MKEIKTYKDYIKTLKDRCSSNSATSKAALAALNAFIAKNPEEYAAFKAKKIEDRKKRMIRLNSASNDYSSLTGEQLYRMTVSKIEPLLLKYENIVCKELLEEPLEDPYDLEEVYADKQMMANLKRYDFALYRLFKSMRFAACGKSLATRAKYIQDYDLWKKEYIKQFEV